MNSAGYLYFKVWVLQDSSKWYKIGITNDLRHRDAEQNVLPVPATTLHSVRFFNIEHARIAEKKFLETLSDYRIKGANNRELLNLKPEQVQAIIGAMKAIKNCTF
ncbi:MAG: GIY-YIG nuclease family protein [Synechococcus sp. YX04-3]|nr:MAG: GIY-YIG nuclease family protein [Synechococcus sp. YX04-3]